MGTSMHDPFSLSAKVFFLPLGNSALVFSLFLASIIFLQSKVFSLTFLACLMTSIRSDRKDGKMNI